MKPDLGEEASQEFVYFKETSYVQNQDSKEQDKELFNFPLLESKSQSQAEF